jgi:hypothetical protein
MCHTFLGNQVDLKKAEFPVNVQRNWTAKSIAILITRLATILNIIIYACPPLNIHQNEPRAIYIHIHIAVK